MQPDLAPVSWVFPGQSLVAALVVAGDTSHQLLCFALRQRGNLVQEIFRTRTAQRAGQDTSMQDLHLACFAFAETEPEVNHRQPEEKTAR
ncbi:hypothetical protein [Piscinibacter sakaiensis]|uniref:hypothetical protein n=1 Tax=Piscinibacter sakaiensis TaxID=1547922 RepID=UPI003AAFBCAC